MSLNFSHRECKNTPTSLCSVRGAARHPDASGCQQHIILHSLRFVVHELARSATSVPTNVMHQLRVPAYKEPELGKLDKICKFEHAKKSQCVDI